MKTKSVNGRYFRRKSILLLEWLLNKRYGKEAFHFWAWECTPWPISRPTWRQILWGYRWALCVPGFAPKHNDDNP